jgi:hypothetical protein
MAQPTVDLKNRRLAALLAWMVPGLGHVYQGRTGKGILYGVSILGLFFVGLALGDWRIIYWRWVSPLANMEQFCFNYLGQFFVGLAALPALIQGTLRYYNMSMGPPLWQFMAEPTPNEINGLYRLGKLLEVGTLYTTVAGLLNILAIYDAYEGPAHVETEEAKPVEEPKPAANLAPATTLEAQA